MPFRIRTPLLALAVAFLPDVSGTAFAQGCIASRGTGITPGHDGVCSLGDEAMHPMSGFQGTVSYRWLHSDRMFSGDQEQTNREAEGSQEINDSHFMDLGITYVFNPRFSATVTLPFSVHDRSQVAYARKFPRTILERFHTQSYGIGDLRAEVNGWILDPANRPKGNVLLGFGFVAPTGESDAQDTFDVVTSGTTIRQQRGAVDQSIQPGSGGWGLVMDFYAYREIVPRLNGFLNGSYTITPEEKYTPTASSFGDYSIADSYLGRGGFDWVIWPKHSLSLSLAGRIDGVPIHDLSGGSEGFRRPGYAVSIEPGISWMVKSWTLAINAPVAVYRNRQLSVMEREAGMTVPVAAGFADFLVTFSVTKQF